MKRVLVFLLALTFFGSVFFMGRNVQGDFIETSPGSYDYFEDLDFKDVVLGSGFGGALTTDGRLFTWGYNNSGQLGDGTNEGKLSPVEITDNFTLVPGERITKIDFGEAFAMALTTHGNIYTWGDNDYGSLGDGTYVNSSIPVNITSNITLEPYDEIIDINVGVFQAAALTSFGELYMWGGNEDGMLGDGTDNDSSLPVHTSSFMTMNQGEYIQKISAGGTHNLLLTSENRLFSWGANNDGQLGDGTTTSSYVPIEITSNLGLIDDERIDLISANYYSSVIATSTNRVLIWGANESGQLGDGTYIGKSNPQDITANFGLNATEHIVEIEWGYENWVAYTNSDRMFGVGYNDDGQLGTGDSTYQSLPYDMTSHLDLDQYEDILSIAQSDYATAILTTDSNLLMMGNNSDGQFGDGTTNDSYAPVNIRENFNSISILQESLDYGETIVAIDVGEMHQGAVTSEGRILMWGGNEYGQLGDGTNIGSYIPIDISSSLNLDTNEKVIDIDCGEEFTMLLTDNGTVYTFGRNNYGQLGDDSVIDSFVPIELPATAFNSEQVVYINTYSETAVAITSIGTVYTWGNNINGLMCDGTFVSKSVPTDITSSFTLPPTTTIDKLVFGLYHAVAIDTNGYVYTWGYNGYGELGNGTTSIVSISTPYYVNVSNFNDEAVIDITAGYHTVGVVTENGAVYIWGHNNAGVLGLGEVGTQTLPVLIPSSSFGDEEVEKIQIGFNTATAITASGKLYAWGNNYDGLLANDTRDNSNIPVLVDYFNDNSILMDSIGIDHYRALGISSDGRLYRWGSKSLGNTTNTRDLLPVQMFQNNKIAYMFVDPVNEFYSNSMPISIFPAYDIGNDLYSITINGVEYLQDDMTITDGRIDIVISNSGMIDQYFEIGINSIQFEVGNAIIPAGAFTTHTLLKDFQAPTFDTIPTQTIEVGSEDVDWTTVMTNIADNSDTPIVVEEISDPTNYSELGTYNVTVRALDASMNETMGVFNVEVIDTTLPVITITGDEEVYIEQGTSYTELGATYTDNYDVSGDAVISGDTVDTATLGTYVVNYDYTDSNGNIAVQVYRTVIIQDTTDPIVSGVEDDTVYDKGTEIVIEFNEGTATLNGEAIQSGDTVTETGEYTLIVTDSSGNMTTTTFTIEGGGNVLIYILIGAAIVIIGGGIYFAVKKGIFES